MPVDLKGLLSGLGEGWVAFPEDYSSVIAHGEDISVVIEEAKSKGYDDPILFQIPKKWSPFVG